MTNRVRTELESAIAADLPDNTTQSITAANLRSACTDLNDSIFRNDAIALSDKTGRILLQQGGYLLYNEYAPQMMLFDGSTGYYDELTHTTSGNKITAVCRFRRLPFTGGTPEILMISFGPADKARFHVSVYPSDHATAGRRNKVKVTSQSAAGSIICELWDAGEAVDGEDHMLFYAYDADIGAATFYLDGSNADDTGHADRVAPTTGALDAGASSTYRQGDSGLLYGGYSGYTGWREAYLTNWSDFTNGNLPKELDESGWTEWGAQPAYFNQHGLMTDNKGSAPNMTKNGVITGPE